MSPRPFADHCRVSVAALPRAVPQMASETNRAPRPFRNVRIARRPGVRETALRCPLSGRPPRERSVILRYSARAAEALPCESCMGSAAPAPPIASNSEQRWLGLHGSRASAIRRNNAKKATCIPDGLGGRPPLKFSFAEHAGGGQTFLRQ
jgi:hypothetical protein